MIRGTSQIFDATCSASYIRAIFQIDSSNIWARWKFGRVDRQPERRRRSSAVFLRDRDVAYYKWGARLPGHQSSANHLLFWNAIEELVSRRARAIDLGRADIRNQGLTRFKKELGAIAEPLPYSFYPRVPARVSPEVLTGTGRFVAKVWTRMPIAATRVLGGAIYRFLA